MKPGKVENPPANYKPGGGGGAPPQERGGGKTPSYLAVKVSFRVAREKNLRRYIWYVYF